MVNLWQNSQKWYICGLTFRVQKNTLQSHNSYSTQKTHKYKLNLVFKKWQAFEKCQNRPFAEAIVRQVRQNWSTLLLNFKDQKYYKKWP